MEDPLQLQPPLEKLRIEHQNHDGIPTLVPALHAGWAEKKQFIKYERPPPNLRPNRSDVATLVGEGLNEKGESNGDKELWLQRMELLQEDLENLLKLPHHRFWSQLLFHDEVHDCLSSYLNLAPRQHDPCIETSEVIREAQRKIHHLVFSIYLRMATYKESQSCRITPSVFGKIIYDNFLFDIPKLMDLCTLYGQENKRLVEKMISNIFENQPQYANDLQEAANVMIQTLKSIEYKLGEHSDDENQGPKKLSDRTQTRDSSELSWKDLLDVIIYLVDIWATLFNFLDVYPKAAHPLVSEGFVGRITSFYETVIPAFNREFKLRKFQSDVLLTLEEAKKRLSFVRICILKTFRVIVESCCFQPILEARKPQFTELVAEDFLQMITAILSEKRFVLDYFERYPFEDDLELLTQSNIELDGNRVDYIRQGISAFASETNGEDGSTKTVRKTLVCAVNGHRDTVEQMQSLSLTDGLTNGDDVLGADNFGAACAQPVVTGEQLQSLISHVKELLPSLGDGFVEACLEYFNYDSEKVINALLEDSLPQSLSQLDKQLPRIKDGPPPISIAFENVLPERRNVFDFDEFDVFSRNDIDMSRVHRGKWEDVSKPGTSSVKSDFHLKNLTLEMSMKYEGADSLYDDEYDDTYDENTIGTAESNTFDELTDRRPFELPRVLADAEKSKNKGQIEEYDDDDEEARRVSEQQQRPKDEFCENPALRREREALKRQQQFRSFTKSKDLKGRPKGQGQEESVLKNRTNKEKNKSSHANHNRRSMADRKRSRGMIPS